MYTYVYYTHRKMYSYKGRLIKMYSYKGRLVRMYSYKGRLLCTQMEVRGRGERKGGEGKGRG